jgi:pimeloyl-ACP methyl ester carboxylesterase
MPVLIMWGAQDRLLSPQAGRWFNTAIPGSKLIVYPKIGHLPQEEAPAQTLTDLQAWLAAQGVQGPAV